MAINAIQAAIRSMTGTERQFSGDLHAYWDQLGIPPGQFAERMVAWKQLPQNAAWIAATEDADAPEGVDGLWRNGEQGVWYDASDLSTMFQDAAGTLPVYMPGKGQVDPPVGLLLDKSGRGNRAFQATTTSRPALSARYNLMTATEFPNGTADTSTKSAGLAAASLSGYAGALAFPAGVTNYGYKTGSVASTVMRLSAVVRMDNGAAPSFGSATPTDSSNDFVFILRGAAVDPSSYITTSIGDGFYLVSAVANTGTNTSDFNGVAKYASNSSRPLKATAYDLRFANDGIGLPPYQRVVDANTYDAAGFPTYLKSDGVDDSMMTTSIDFSAFSQLMLALSARKLSDAAVAELLGFSATPSTSSGAFGVLAPPSATPRIEFSACATTNGYAQIASAAPESAVFVAQINLSVATVAEGKLAVRKNGASAVPVQTGSGTGTANFGNYPLHLFRRGGSSLPWGGRFYGLIIRGGASSNAQISAVERYLNSKARIY